MGSVLILIKQGEVCNADMIEIQELLMCTLTILAVTGNGIRWKKRVFGFILSFHWVVINHGD